MRIRVANLKPGFILITIAGGAKLPGDRAVEDALFREFEIELERSGMLTVFADIRETTRMAGESRELTTNWMRKYRAQLNPAHTLFRSKLMEMAMSLIAMVVGGGMINTYSKPQAFLEAIRAVAPRITALPTVDR